MFKKIYIICIVYIWCLSECNSFVNGHSKHDGVRHSKPSSPTELLLTLENVLDWEKIFSGSFISNATTCGQAIVNASALGLAYRYVDAMGKPGSGIMRGNIFWIGSYRECVAIENAHYCTLFDVELQGKPLVLGTCVPMECNATDIENLFRELANETNTIANKSILDVKPNQFVSIYGQDSSFCSTKKEFSFNESVGETIILTLCIIIAVLCFIGTLADAMQSIRKNLQHPHDNEINCANVSVLVAAASTSNPVSKSAGARGGNVTLHPVVIQEKGEPIMKFLTCFSLIRNTKALLRTDTSSTVISSLPGIRVFSLLWVMIGHLLFYAFTYSPIGDIVVLQGKWIERFTMQALLNSALAVDTFFLLGGMLVSYHGLARYETLGHLNIFRFILHRIFRIMPVYLFLLLFYMYVFPYLSSGPYWFAHGPDSEEVKYCETNWWTNMIYINDLYPPVEEGCFKWSWYLAVDMQYYILSIVFIWCMWKSAKYGVYVLNTLAIIACMVTNGCLIYKYDATPIFNVNTIQNFFFGKNSPLLQYMDFIYTKPYTRFTSYSVGLVLGYLLLHNKKYNGRFPMLFHASGWLIAGCLATLVVYVPYTRNDSEWTSVENILYGATFRFGWALSVAWLIYSCHAEYGGLVNEFLSWKGFIPISRLTYSAYLSHVMVLFYYFGSLETPLYIDDLTLSFLYTGVVMITFMLAFIIGVCIEYPVFNLEKLIFRTA